MNNYVSDSNKLLQQVLKNYYHKCENYWFDSITITESQPISVAKSNIGNKYISLSHKFLVKLQSFNEKDCFHVDKWNPNPQLVMLPNRNNLELGPNFASFKFQFVICRILICNSLKFIYKSTIYSMMKMNFSGYTKKQLISLIIRKSINQWVSLLVGQSVHQSLH